MDLHRWDMYIHAWITVILDTIYIHTTLYPYLSYNIHIYIYKYTYYALNSCGFVSACKAMAEHPGSALELPPQDGQTWADPFLFVKKNRHTKWFCYGSLCYGTVWACLQGNRFARKHAARLCHFRSRGRWPLQIEWTVSRLVSPVQSMQWRNPESSSAATRTVTQTHIYEHELEYM